MLVFRLSPRCFTTIVDFQHLWLNICNSLCQPGSQWRFNTTHYCRSRFPLPTQKVQYSLHLPQKAAISKKCGSYQAYRPWTFKLFTNWVTDARIDASTPECPPMYRTGGSLTTSFSGQVIQLKDFMNQSTFESRQSL